MNRISNYIAFISLFFVIVSCNSHLNGVSQGVNYALKKSGNNCNELEKVLLYYQNDSLRYEAACFLIENMVGHFSNQGSATDFYKQKLRMRLKPFSRDFLDSLWKETSVRYSDEEATYASNRVLRGTTVVDGHGTMRVLSVGDDTEIGKVARQSTEQSTEPTPLNIQLTKLANLIGKIGFSVAGLAFAIFFIKDVILVYPFSTFHTFADWLPALKATLQYFMMAVTLIVVAVPEGLPMSVTLSLALNMRRMLSTNNLVRKMHACETMGAITVICTDKTGTLTQNLMQVYEPSFYGLKNGGEVGEDDISKLVIEGISTNSTAFLEEIAEGEKPKGVGNPTEVALLLWLNSRNRDYLELRENAPVVDQLTFSTERKFMATLVKSPLMGKKVLYVKGAPEIVLGKCKDVILDGKRVDAVEYRSTVEKQLLGYQNPLRQSFYL